MSSPGSGARTQIPGTSKRSGMERPRIQTSKRCSVPLSSASSCEFATSRETGTGVDDDDDDVEEQSVPVRYKTDNSSHRKVTLNSGTAPLTLCVLVFAPFVPLFALVELAPQPQFHLTVASSEASSVQHKNCLCVGIGLSNTFRSHNKSCVRLTPIVAMELYVVSKTLQVSCFPSTSK